ncbi:MATE family efflux transporter [uncultured Piscinibacter sp.]|uniref:MATE family efflux transporter n=1 Tax=uncultured Piscinibacter sp. TaxID=1131835 RepID=UPI0026319369|nr:MATE family efflux transporter [uncultured Piscinibacter sp.]
MSRLAKLAGSAKRIAPLAWPVFVGQVAVLAFSTVDTMMAARAGGTDLAALAIGGAAYITVFIGLMGIVLAISPIAGQLFGAQHFEACGAQLHQAMWLALLLSVPGCLLLLFPQPFLDLARAEPAVAEKVRGHLAALAVALPPALLFTAFRGFNIAVSRPKIVMLLQLGALALKVPLTALFVFGAGPVPALGAPGCGVATASCMVLQLAAVWTILTRDPFYARFHIGDRFSRPHRGSLLALVRLGVPMGGSIMIEVTGFTFMAFFISRLGATPVAGHQIAVNLVSLMFMMPLAIANAASTLVAQRIGAGDEGDAHRIGWHGVEIGVAIAALMGGAVYLLREPIIGLYTADAVIVAAAMPLLAWVAAFHIADAAQAVAGFVLRAYRIALVPLLIYALAIWGVGLAGGYAVGFNLTGLTPPALLGAAGMWSAATTGLVVAATGMCGFLGWMIRSRRRRASRPGAT